MKLLAAMIIGWMFCLCLEEYSGEFPLLWIIGSHLLTVLSTCLVLTELKEYSLRRSSRDT